MRALLAVSLLASTVACVNSISEPLQSTDLGNQPRLARPGAEAQLAHPALQMRDIPTTGAETPPVEETPPADPQQELARAAIADLAAANLFAAEVSYDAINAALLGDRGLVQEAAAEAAEAAATAQSRASEAMTAFNVEGGGGDGCGGAEQPDPVGDGEVTGGDIDAAVLAAANAAQATGELADALEPTPVTEECGCGGCTQVGGEPDPVAVQDAIGDVQAAGDACAAVSEELDGGSATIG